MHRHNVEFSTFKQVALLQFLKNNIALLIAITIALFICYGIKLFEYSIGIDTEQIISFKTQTYALWESVGRFGLVLLHKIIHIGTFNPSTAFLITFCLIWLFTVSWCYIIAAFQQNTGTNHTLIPFALVFITSPFWAEQFYFVLQSAEVALMVLLCPWAIYFMFCGFIHNKTGKIIFAFLSLVLMISVYQAMIILFCSGVFICFMLLLETTDYKPAVYRNLCFKFFATIVLAVIAFSAIDRIVIPSVFHIEKAMYLDSMNKWGQVPVKENMLRILFCGYKLTVGSQVFGNFLLLPIAVLFMVKVKTAKKSPLYLLAGILLPLSIMFLAFAGGNNPPMRALYVVPLVFAFMYLSLIKTALKNGSKKVSVTIIVLALLTAAYQMQTTARLFYSDQIRYREDVRMANEIHNIITNTNQANFKENLPVAIIGKYKPKFGDVFLQGEAIGHSFFEWGQDTRETTERSLDFMRALGINFNSPTDEQLKHALTQSNSMPAYPNEGYIKKTSDVIVVNFLPYSP